MMTCTPRSLPTASSFSCTVLKSAASGSSVVNMVMEKMSSRMVWLMSSMFALHAARVVATAATMPLRSLPKTEMTHFMNGSFL